ncbi:hypothetical protein [Bailinhaonella thermotolerans]|uniref:hypothetical protein n=1 Tax=Bailinhaonella thermotolerans TaxID=1070861 RepID=UPI0011C3597F|nr:hypothetical protein [Bailinhaonella thermotolerans]
MVSVICGGCGEAHTLREPRDLAHWTWDAPQPEFAHSPLDWWRPRTIYYCPACSKSREKKPSPPGSLMVA